MVINKKLNMVMKIVIFLDKSLFSMHPGYEALFRDSPAKNRTLGNSDLNIFFLHNI